MSKIRHPDILIINADQVQKEYFKDLLRYRELFYFLAWRDIVVRYKQTFLGVLWALIRPILNMAVFAFVFGKIAQLPSDSVNYPLFVLAGMLPWQLFAGSLVDTSQSLVNNAPMISKIYFPRIILPVSHIMVHFIDFLISFVFLMFVFLVTGYLTHWTIFLLPLFIALTLLLCLGTSLWLAAATVRFRDFRFIIPFLVQFGVFISPVGYSSFLLPESWQWIYFLNPMAGIIEGFRWCYFGTFHPDLPIAITLSCIINFGILVTGFRYFRQMERLFADII
ncbi:MAG: ABC transporter permease [Parachlamydiaceae bacterium]|nr:ABC transporter permease [Parachlamydiaceae bacterium]